MGQMLSGVADVWGKRLRLPRTEGDGEGEELMEAKLYVCVLVLARGGSGLVGVGEDFGSSVTSLPGGVRYGVVLRCTGHFNAAF